MGFVMSLMGYKEYDAFPGVYFKLIPVSRQEWGAKPPRTELPPGPTPFTNVVLHWADVPACDSKNECIQTVQHLQKRHVDFMAMPDIKYNFMIGGDGNAYEGRGWTKMAHPLPKDVENAEPYRDNSLHIGLLDILNRKPSGRMTRAASELVAIGLAHKYITQDFQTGLLRDGKIIKFVKPPQDVLSGTKSGGV